MDNILNHIQNKIKTWKKGWDIFPEFAKPFFSAN